ncbi:hypothetical protein AOT83_22670 [Mycobacteroides sp. H001]|nr:hypothetical protein AOT86_10090 [Mycobacteroides sp. H072]KRQ34184.1 hypothetical protein AOT84_19765 [Mycobacteroides sp. H002]KRQ53843.1 hypothetical protein AOT85_07195 [Mycobacteroides sp. H054]KRQ66739.1 hypothetical protein AOT83_22670 [Mycobacteroides sp. H001]
MRSVRVRTAAIVLATGVALFGAASCSERPSAQGNAATASPSERGQFIASYKRAATGATTAEEAFLRARRVLEDFVDNMNGYLRIPRDVQVIAKDCGESNAFYDTDQHAIELCYELSGEERAVFSSAGDSGEQLDTEVYQSVVATLYHELGHALIAELDLKITGREEDVADQLAVYVLTGDEDSKEFLLTTADSYALRAGRGSLHDSDFADAHSLDGQRAVNFLCYVYGSDEQEFHYLVDHGDLDSGRAEGCADEYDKLVAAWGVLLTPHAR